MPATVPHVVVVGAGFGGLTATRKLAGLARSQRLRVTLVDRRNHHTFQPLLYQVATSGLQPQDVGHPLRPIFGLRRFRHRATAVDVRLGEVVEVDREAQTIVLADGGRIAYDHLIVAAGATTADFGLPGVEEHGFPLKTIAEALELRDHILRQFELVATDDAPGRLTFVVAGGGPTGVEMAGALAELVDHVLRRDHPTLDMRRVEIVLLEAADGLLGGFHQRLGRYALRELRARGVSVRLGAALARAEGDHVVLADGTTIPTRTLVWVAGVRAAPLAQALGVTTGPGGRVPVDERLRLAGDPAVRVIGDMAAARDGTGELFPQVAPVAMQQARWVVADLAADLLDVPGPPPFRYFDKGTMATVGRNRAVAQLPLGIRITGFPAWVAWLGLHLLYLVGFRNRVAVFLSWIWNYLTYDRAARLILHDEESLDVDRRGHEPRRERPAS